MPTVQPSHFRDATRGDLTRSPADRYTRVLWSFVRARATSTSSPYDSICSRLRYAYHCIIPELQLTVSVQVRVKPRRSKTFYGDSLAAYLFLQRATKDGRLYATLEPEIWILHAESIDDTLTVCFVTV